MDDLDRKAENDNRKVGDINQDYRKQTYINNLNVHPDPQIVLVRQEQRTTLGVAIFSFVLCGVVAFLAMTGLIHLLIG